MSEENAPKPVDSHGKVMYLLLPSRDPQESADFYRDVFGWQIRDTNEGLAFMDGAGSMAGRWVTDASPANDPGMTLFIMVRDARETERLIAEHGGTVESAADLEAFDALTIFRDPSGNKLGAYEMKPGDPG